MNDELQQCNRINRELRWAVHFYIFFPIFNGLGCWALARTGARRVYDALERVEYKIIIRMEFDRFDCDGYGARTRFACVRVCVVWSTKSNDPTKSFRKLDEKVFSNIHIVNATHRKRQNFWVRIRCGIFVTSSYLRPPSLPSPSVDVDRACDTCFLLSLYAYQRLIETATGCRVHTTASHSIKCRVQNFLIELSNRFFLFDFLLRDLYKQSPRAHTIRTRNALNAKRRDKIKRQHRWCVHQYIFPLLDSPEQSNGSAWRGKILSIKIKIKQKNCNTLVSRLRWQDQSLFVARCTVHFAATRSPTRWQLNRCGSYKI